MPATMPVGSDVDAINMPFADQLSSSLACIASRNAARIRTYASSDNSQTGATTARGTVVTASSTSGSNVSGGDDKGRASGNASGNSSGRQDEDSYGAAAITATSIAPLHNRSSSRTGSVEHRHHGRRGSTNDTKDSKGLPNASTFRRVRHTSEIKFKLPPAGAPRKRTDNSGGRDSGGDSSEHKSSSSLDYKLRPLENNVRHNKWGTEKAKESGSSSSSNGNDNKYRKQHRRTTSDSSTTSLDEDGGPRKLLVSRTPQDETSVVKKKTIVDGSSGSGTDGGYAGSASSNENTDMAQFSGSSENNFSSYPSNSPSLSSGDGGSSDEQDDAFGSGGVNNTANGGSSPKFQSRKKVCQGQSSSGEKVSRKRRHDDTRFNENSLDTLEKDRAIRQLRPLHHHHRRSRNASTRSQQWKDHYHENGGHPDGTRTSNLVRVKTRTVRRKPPLLTLGSDLMANVLSFLDPSTILEVLTSPISQEWRANYTNQSELWRVLCLMEPFKARVDDRESSSDDSSSDSSYSGVFWTQLRPTKFGKFRILYTSFVKCARYLDSIKEDVLHGRLPAVIDLSVNRTNNYENTNRTARDSVTTLYGRSQVISTPERSIDTVDPNGAASQRNEAGQEINHIKNPSNVRKMQVAIQSDSSGHNRFHGSNKKPKKHKRKKKFGYGYPTLTDRLLGPSPGGRVLQQNFELPWSCALYSIVNWMVAFSDVEGIQIMCLRVLPFLLEHEEQRVSTQRVGDVVLRGMVRFPNSAELHTVSFHAIVLLARPPGGQEGMLFHAAMSGSEGLFSGGNDASALFSGSVANRRNGIAVMLDSMRRFEDDERLQAMACWSLVNIALVPSQKEVLVKLGGIEVTANAMIRHPHKVEVQFRALFALINLVIPSVNRGDEIPEDETDGNYEGIAGDLDEFVGQIVHLVVVAMKNFCSSEAIMNRACLVLHNLSLTDKYHSNLLWTPSCYQMLEWCLANYRTDQVLQQSVSGTLQRLQVTLSNDENLRTRFHASLQAQQQQSLVHAQRESLQMYDLQQLVNHNGRS